jgi:hypothetical protein
MFTYGQFPEDLCRIPGRLLISMGKGCWALAKIMLGHVSNCNRWGYPGQSRAVIAANQA